MEIREHSPNRSKFKTGINKNVGFSRTRANLSPVLSNRVFQGPNGGRAYGDYASSILQSPINFAGRFGRDQEALGVQFVFFHALAVHGLKRSQADMQGDLRGVDAALRDLGKDLGGEMKT